MKFSKRKEKLKAFLKKKFSVSKEFFYSAKKYIQKRKFKKDSKELVNKSLEKFNSYKFSDIKNQIILKTNQLTSEKRFLEVRENLYIH